MSPAHFYSEELISEASEGMNGILIGGQRYRQICRWSGDYKPERSDIQEMVSRIAEKGEDFGMGINVEKLSNLNR